MTIIAIKEAMKSLKQLYINSMEVEIIFFDELTETIEVKYKDTNTVTFVTKCSLSVHKKNVNSIVIDDLLILKYREDRNV